MGMGKALDKVVPSTADKLRIMIRSLYYIASWLGLYGDDKPHQCLSKNPTFLLQSR